MSSIQVPETVTAQPSARAGGWIWALVITCVLLWVSMHARIGWDAPITEAHAWRQTQTAISAYYLVGQPFHLAYETPTLGPPWSVPMEFPFYQLAVARLVDLTGLELVPAGRLVGLFCFFATAFPLWYIASLLSGSRTLAIGAAALFLSSAYYAFWSRTFMIESLSLLLGVSFLAAFMIAWNGKSWRWAGVATTLGALAGLAKVTTFALFMAAAVLYLFSTRWRDWQRRLSSEGAARTLGSILRESVFPLVILSGAIAVAVWWVSFSDQVKREHPLGAEMASKAMTHWNFGTLAQKTDLQTWKLIAGRSLAAIGERIPALALLLLSGAAVWRSRRYRGAFLGCLFLCGLGPMVFTNLYYVHDYYYNGNLIFALVALWFGALALMQSRQSSVRWRGYLLLGAGVGMQLWEYPHRYVPIIAANPDEENAAFMKMAERVRTTTPPNTAIVWITNKGAPVVPFYSQRKTLTLGTGPQTPGAAQAVRNLARESVSAVANSAEDQVAEEWVLRLLGESGVEPVVIRP